MPLVKTEKAREALGRRDGLLRQVDRQLLIMCDGLRSESALAAMMGPDTAPALQRLVSAGYLADAASLTPPLPAAAVPPMRTPATMAEPARPQANPAPAAQAAAAPASPPVQAPAGTGTGTRRSLAAAKVYTVGMLQLIRDPEAVEHVSTIQTSNEEDTLVRALFASLRYLGRKAATTYCRRVSDRLLEILPEHHLPALNAVIDEIFTDVMV